MKIDKSRRSYVAVAIFSFLCMGYALFAYQDLQSNEVNAASTPISFQLGENVSIGTTNFTVVTNDGSLTALADEAFGSYTVAQSQGALSDVSSYGILGGSYIQGKLSIPSSGDLSAITDTTSHSLTTVPPAGTDWWLSDPSVDNRSKFVDDTNSLVKEMTNKVGVYVNNECGVEDKVEAGLKPTGDTDNDVIIEMSSGTGTAKIQIQKLTGGTHNMFKTGQLAMSYSFINRTATYTVQNNQIVEPVTIVDLPTQFAIDSLPSGIKAGETISIPFKANAKITTGNPKLPTGHFDRSVTIKFTIKEFTSSDGEITRITCDGITQTPGTSAVRPLVRIPSSDILYAGDTKKEYSVSNKVTGSFPISSGDNKRNLVLSTSDISVSLDSTNTSVQGNKFTTVLPEDNIVSIPVQWKGGHEGTRYVSAKVGDNYTVLGELTSDKGSVEVDVSTLSDDIENADSVSLALFAEDSGSGSTAYMDGGTGIEISFETIDSVSLKDTKNADVSSLTYGDVTGGGTIGSFSLTTSTGVNDNPTFQFVDDANGTNPSTSKGSFELSGTDLKVKTGEKLNAGEHAFFIKSTSKNGSIDVREFTINVGKRKVSVDTLIDNKTTASFNVGGTFPSVDTYGYKTVNNTSFVDSLTPSYEFHDTNGNVVDSSVMSTTTGTYTLHVKFLTAEHEEDTNYTVTLTSTARLTVSSHSITGVTLSKTTFTYGDTGTKTGEVIGNLSITTDDGNGQSNPTFILSDVDGNAQTHPKIELDNGQIKVKAGETLSVGTYTFYVTATSSDTSLPSKTAELSVVVNKKKITVSVKDPASIEKKTGELLSSFTAAYTVTPALIGDDMLTGSATYTYDGSYTDTSLGDVKIKVKGLTSTNYDITFAGATINVTQKTLKDTDYTITGTQNSDKSWYQDDITITISDSAKALGFDEFVNADGVSLQDTITLDTSKVYTNYAIQLRNSTSMEITSVARKTLSLDKIQPEYALTATLPDGSAYTSGSETDQTIQVAINTTTTNPSPLTYYMSTNANAASTQTYEDISNAEYEWEVMNGRTASFSEYTNGEKTVYFIVASKAELVGDVVSININNTKKIPNPSGLNWNVASDMEITYGETKDISVNMPKVSVVYTLTDDSGGDASECLRIDQDTYSIQAIRGTCDASNITLSAQVGNYATPLTKQITVKKAPLSLETVYKEDTKWVNNLSIIKNDAEPEKITRIAAGSSFVGDEKNFSGADDLGTYQYTYTDSSQATSTTLDTGVVGTYLVHASIQEATLTDIDDKYDITWIPAHITINTINIAAKDAYEITGTKKAGFETWYSDDVTITPIHSIYGYMSIDEAPAKYEHDNPYVLSENGTHTVTLTFDDNSGIDDHSVSYTETIQLDKQKPSLEIIASSNGSAYESGTITNDKIIISSIRQPADQVNVSGATYYYTLDPAYKDREPYQADGTIDSHWIEVSGSLEVEKESTFYFKAVSGAGVSGDAVEFHANYVKLDTSVLPQVSVTSNEKAYPADGSWTTQVVTFTLSGSTTGYEVCSSTSDDPTGCTWRDISDVANARHEIVSSVTNMKYWFRIKHPNAVYDPTTAYLVSLDTVKPNQPEILTKMKNDSTFSQIVNALTFGMFLNKEVEVSINSTDEESGLDRIEYDLYDKDGNRIDHQVYDQPLRYQNAQLELRATAWDIAGNSSQESIPVVIEVDTIAPVLHGVSDQASYYVPRYVTIEENGSGINKDETVYTNNKASNPFKSGTLFKGHGIVGLSVADNAGNTIQVSFTIKEKPKVEDLTKSEEDRQIVHQVEQEYEEMKDYLSEEECKEIEEWLKQAKETTIVYVNSVREPITNVTVEGVDGTTFEFDVELVVEIVTTELELQQIDLSEVHGLHEDIEIKDAYDIYLKVGEEKVQPDGKVRVKIPYTEKEKKIQELKVVYIDDRNIATVYPHEIIEDEDGEWITFETTHFSHYALVGKAEDILTKNEVNIDTDGDGLPDLNLDFDHDGVPELNIDTTLNRIPNVDIDTDGDGLPDVNIDVNTDGVADKNIKKITTWKPNENYEYLGMKYDTMADVGDDNKQPQDSQNSQSSQNSQNTQNLVSSSPNTEVNNGSKTGSNTGDDTNALWYSFLLISAVGILLSLRKKKA